MSTFDHIVLTIATGPVIASPTIEWVKLKRSELSDADAQQVDRLIAEADFFQLGDLTVGGLPGRPGVTFPRPGHKSSMKIDMTDGHSHSVLFVVNDLPGQLQPIYDFVRQHGRSESND